MFNHRDRAKQLVDFSNMRYGSIMPTDLDGCVEFGGKLFVFFELKVGDAPCPFGQKLFLERLADNFCNNGKIGVSFIAEHNTPVDQDIDCSLCVLREYRWEGRWIRPKYTVTLHDAIQRLYLTYVHR